MTISSRQGGFIPRARTSLDPKVRALQIDEVYRFAGTAAAFSFLGALLTLGVLADTGDMGRGVVWFVWATAVTCLRFAAVISYRRRDAQVDPEPWAKLLIACNFLAGIQWGVLGTLLFPHEHGYRELFTIMTITCFVGGSVTAYAAVRGAHEALSIPATIPTGIYLFFVQDGIQFYAGLTAIFFCFAIVYYSRKLHRHMEERFRLQVEHEDLLRVTGGVAERLSIENRELQHRAAVRSASMESAREQAERLGTLFLRSPLPMIECDAHAQVVTANAAAERLLGERDGELVGRPIASHLAVVGRKPWDASGVDGYLGTADATTLEVEVMSHGVRVAKCTASFTRLHAPDGLRPGFAVILAAPPR